MGTEIERKWLVSDESWKQRPHLPTTHIQQGYLSFGADQAQEVRLRLETCSPEDTRAFLTTKSKGGLIRTENEISIDPDIARKMFSLCQGHVIKKNRTRIQDESGLLIEIDEYQGELQGLVVAEVEFTKAEEQFSAPSFLGKEVTEDQSYKNASLAQYGLPETFQQKKNNKKPGP